MRVSLPRSAQLLSLFALVFGFYAASAPRRIAFEDDGSFVMAAESLGIPHPPGYPLWVVLAHPFSWLEVGSMAYRVHLSSAFFGAAACCALFALLLRLGIAPLFAWCAVPAFAVSDLLWSQSIIAEVYTLNLLAFLLALLLCVEYADRPRRPTLAAAGLVFGLGLSNHYPLLLLAAPAPLLVLWPVRRRALRDAIAAVPAVLVGLLPYAWLFLRSRAEPSMSFYGPMRDLRELAFYVVRRGYDYGGVGVGPGDVLRFELFMVREAAAQLTPVGLALAAFGSVRAFQRLGAALGLGLVLAFLGGTVLLVPLVVPAAGFAYEYFSRIQMRVYPLLPWAVLAVWLAFGLEGLAQRLAGPLGANGRRAVALCGVALVAWLAFENAPRNWRRGYTAADDYARTILESLERGSSVFTRADIDALPLGYLHFSESVRPDLTLYHTGGLVYPTRLFHGRTRPRVQAERVEGFLSRAEHPVYFTGGAPRGFAREEFGLYTRVGRSRSPRRPRPAVRPELLALVRRLHEDRSGDPWTRYAANVMVTRTAALLADALHGPGAETGEPYRAQLEQLGSRFHGRYGVLLAAAAREDPDPSELLALAAEARARIDDTVALAEKAGLLAIEGRALLALDRVREAEARFEAALHLRPHAGNPAALELLRLAAERGDAQRYRALRERVLPGVARSRELRSLDRRAGYAPTEGP